MTNSFSVSVKTEGLDEIQLALETIESRLAKKVTRLALRRARLTLARAIRSAGRPRSKRVSRNVRFSSFTQLRNKKGFITGSGVPRSAPGRSWLVAFSIERGNPTKSGKGGKKRTRQQAAKPFIVPTAEKISPQLVDVFRSTIRSELDL